MIYKNLQREERWRKERKGMAEERGERGEGKRRETRKYLLCAPDLNQFKKLAK